MISIQYIIDKKLEKKSYYPRAARWAAIQYTNIKVSPLKILYEESNDDFEENSMPSYPQRLHQIGSHQMLMNLLMDMTGKYVNQCMIGN